MRFLIGMILGAALYAFYIGDLKMPEQLKPQTETSGFFKRLGDMFNR